MNKNKTVLLAILIVAILGVSELNSKPKEFIYYLPLEYGASYNIFQGNNQDPTHNDKGNRYAFDFSPMPVGTPVVAVADGVVTAVKEDTVGPTGNWKDNNFVAIRHADGNVSEYLHLKQNGVVVEVGQEVMAGNLIAYSGNTGNSGGPHLHFGLRKGHRLSGPSVPCKFADVKDDGIPKTGDMVTSKNFPIRYRKEFDKLQNTTLLFRLCFDLGYFEMVAKKLKAFSKLKIPMPLKVFQDAIKKRDECLVQYQKAVEDALEAIKTARQAKDLKTAVHLAYFGVRDFSKSEKNQDFKKALAELREEEEYKEAIASLKSERNYRTKIQRAIKSELKLNKKEKKGKGSKVSYLRVIKQYEQALTDAPVGRVADNLKKHIEELKAR